VRRASGAERLTPVILVAVLAAVASVPLAWADAAARRERDLARLVFDSTAASAAVLDTILARNRDSLEALLAAEPSAPDAPTAGQLYLVVSVAENRLWLKRGNDVLFTTRVATGTGGELKAIGGRKVWKFDTPRGRLVVERKDVDPLWVPPDWHFVELARKRKLRLVFLKAGMEIPLGDGAVIRLSGNDVVRREADGSETPYDNREGLEIVVGKQLIVPPLGTNQRQFPGVMGSHRLYLGDGYGIHGTDAPGSIGRSASHGCIRVRNEDIEVLYQLVPLGTPVFVY
jgi:lipoprotein-anchoring transpeptidase ErfK/SrfK